MEFRHLKNFFPLLILSSKSFFNPLRPQIFRPYLVLFLFCTAPIFHARPLKFLENVAFFRNKWKLHLFSLLAGVLHCANMVIVNHDSWYFVSCSWSLIWLYIRLKLTVRSNILSFWVQSSVLTKLFTGLLMKEFGKLSHSEVFQCY